MMHLVLTGIETENLLIQICLSQLTTPLPLMVLLQDLMEAISTQKIILDGIGQEIALSLVQEVQHQLITPLHQMETSFGQMAQERTQVTILHGIGVGIAPSLELKALTLLNTQLRPMEKSCFLMDQSSNLRITLAGIGVEIVLFQALKDHFQWIIPLLLMAVSTWPMVQLSTKMSGLPGIGIEIVQILGLINLSHMITPEAQMHNFSNQCQSQEGMGNLQLHCGRETRGSPQLTIPSLLTTLLHQMEILCDLMAAEQDLKTILGGTGLEIVLFLA